MFAQTAYPTGHAHQNFSLESVPGGGGRKDLDPVSKRFKAQSGHKEACQLFVRNLPKRTCLQVFKEHFRKCGNVTFSEIGRNKRCGFVRFATAKEAQHVIETWNGMEMMGRTSFVKLDGNA